MTIYCKLCNHRVDSKKRLDAKSEESDVLESLSRHLVARHVDEASLFKNDLESMPLLIATYLLIKRYVRIPAESKALQEHFDQNEQLILQFFDIDVTQTS